ncbi:MAG: DEAD/DEAH box helicase [Patescibacteria group bacterium]
MYTKHRPQGGKNRFQRSTRPPFRGGGRRFGAPKSGHNRFKDQTFSDVSKFVYKVSVIEEAEVIAPKHSFNDFVIDERIKTAIEKKGYTIPTPIQDQSIPYILEGKDVVGIANTGTGKTAAFLIPLLHKIFTTRNQSALVIVPTRELAIQIEEELRGFTRGTNIYSACIVGGAPMRPQLIALRRRPHVVIGTPGRLKDMIEHGYLDLSGFQSVVLDEADRMLDMGFIGDVKFMMAKTPKDRHTLFFSATMSPEITALISQFLKDPVTVSVKTRDTAKNVDQDVVRLKEGERKLEKLVEVLRGEGFHKVLIFGRTKHGVEALSKDLIKHGFLAESIHGDKNHAKRQRALTQFKKNHVTILVATDVAARGLDIADVSHVINYDLPGTYEDYIHRIGRTGRAGKAGKALTFIELPYNRNRR